MNNEININAGISFVQFGEKTNYNLTHFFTSDTTLIYSDSITFLSWDSINHIVYIAFTDYEVDSTFLDSTLLNETRRNTHSYFNIPLLIGYNFNFNKLDVNLKAGIGIGFLIKSKASYLNYELNNFMIPEPKELNLNYIFSPAINYKISTNLSLQINPQLLINSSNLINYKDLKQQYSNWSLHFGVSYLFKEKINSKSVINKI